MNLDSIKLKTTWNDAVESINKNFAKLHQGVSGNYSVLLDDEMLDDSENAVQNKVIKKYIDIADTYLEGYAEEKAVELGNNIKENPSEYIPLKTINGNSIYGTGDIVIEGGGGGGSYMPSDFNNDFNNDF